MSKENYDIFFNSRDQFVKLAQAWADKNCLELGAKGCDNCIFREARNFNNESICRLFSLIHLASLGKLDDFKIEGVNLYDQLNIESSRGAE